MIIQIKQNKQQSTGKLSSETWRKINRSQLFWLFNCIKFPKLRNRFLSYLHFEVDISATLLGSSRTVIKFRKSPDCFEQK